MVGTIIPHQVPLSFLPTATQRLSMSPSPSPSSSVRRRRRPSSSCLNSLGLKCSMLSVELEEQVMKPQPAEVARTIMELSSVGTLSTLTPDGWPIAMGVRFTVDVEDGTPIVCFPKHVSMDQATTRRMRTSFHVQLEQSGGMRTPQCTIQGTLHKPEEVLVKKFHSLWKRKFGEALKEDLIHVISVEQVIQVEDFMEGGIWIPSSDYKAASPDPLRDFAEKIVDEINTHHREDVLRFCSIYVDMDLPVTEAKMVWVDRLGFDMRVRSIENDTYEVRIPFRREVTDEKGVKSSFNSMSQIAWEVEKNYYTPDFNKVKQMKKISS